MVVGQAAYRMCLLGDFKIANRGVLDEGQLGGLAHSFMHLGLGVVLRVAGLPRLRKTWSLLSSDRFYYILSGLIFVQLRLLALPLDVRHGGALKRLGCGSAYFSSL